jgi:nicotinamide riboside transporter PnuC
MCKCVIPAFPFELHADLIIAIVIEMTVSISLILKWTSHGRTKESTHKEKWLVEARSSAIELTTLHYYVSLESSDKIQRA